MGRLYRRSDDGAWWGDWTDADGKRQQRSLRTKDKSVAKGRLRAAELGKAARTRQAPYRLSEAIDYMLTATCHDKAAGTRHMYETKARRLLATLGDVDVNDITVDMLSEYVNKRRNGLDGVPVGAPGTVVKELVTLRRALAQAVKRGKMTRTVESVMPDFRAKYTPRERYLTVPEHEALCRHLSPARALWVALATLGGLRSSEVERVTWAMVDLATGWLRVPGSKTAKSRRRVPIVPALAHQLAHATRTGELVVTPWKNVRRDLHIACAKAHIAPVSPNDLRRTFASWLKQHGADSMAVATMMGHSSTRMVELVYGKLDDASYQRAIAVFPESRATTVTTIVTPLGHLVATPGHSGRTDGGQAGTPVSDENLRNYVVPRDGVEPPTRGFSVPVHDVNPEVAPEDADRQSGVQRGRPGGEGADDEP